MEKSSRTQKSALNFITGTGGELLSTMLKFVKRTVFISTLGQSYLGINGLFSDILSMLSLTELGIDTAINFRLYKPLAEKNMKRVRVLMKFFRAAYMIIGTVILCMGLCIIPLLKYLIKDYDSLAALNINAAMLFIMFLLKSVCSYLFFAYRTAVIKADQKTYVINIADFGLIILENIVDILILLLTRNFMLYTASAILTSIIKNFVNAYIAQKMYPEVFKKEEDSLSREELRDMLKDCGALLAYKTNSVVLKATDNMVLSSFVGLSIVGIYSNYLLIYTTIKSFLARFYTATKASFGNIFAVEKTETKYRMFEVMNFITALFYGTACVGVSVVGNEFIDCWVGKDYLIAQPFPVLIGIEIFFAGIKNNLGQVRNLSGAFQQMWFRPILGIIINIGVSIALVKPMGIYGVIIGTISADVLTNFMVDPSVIHKYSFNNYKKVSAYYRRNLQYMLVLTVICTVDWLICSNVFVGHGWLSFIVHMVICGLSVPSVFGLLYRNTYECKYLVGKIRGVVEKKNLRKIN